MIPVFIATEDELSEHVLRRILRDVPEIDVSLALWRGGFGYLRRNAHAWNQSSQGTPFIVLTDLDRGICASALIFDWLSNTRRNPDFLLRVAVREVEAWLLADAQTFSQFLGVRPSQIPDEPENLDDPKATLVALARRSTKRDIRTDIAPARGSIATQGPGYNDRLRPFVEQDWNPRRARENAPSLDRAIRAIESLLTRKQSA